MKVWCIGRRVAGETHVPDQLAAREWRAIANSRRISIEMRIHQNELLGGVGRVDHESTGFAREELEYAAARRRQNRRSARGHDVESFVTAHTATKLIEVALQFVGIDAGKRHRQFRMECVDVGWRWLHSRHHSR